MEKETWKVGKYGSTVVSDTKQQNTNFPSSTNPTERNNNEIEFYGGYLVAESIGNNKSAKLIAAAPELLEACIAVMKGGYGCAPSVEIMDSLKLKCESAIKKATE